MYSLKSTNDGRVLFLIVSSRNGFYGQKAGVQAGIGFIGPVQHPGSARWAHFREPDENVYEIISQAD